MGAKCPKQFLLNLYLHKLQKEIAKHIAILQPITLSCAIQWEEHVEMVTHTYSGVGPSNKGSSLGGGGNSGNRGGRGGRSFGWRGGNKGGQGNGGRSTGQQKNLPNFTFNKNKNQNTVC